MQTAIEYINYFVALLFCFCYSYQFLYMIISIFHKPVKFRKAKQENRYAFMIAGRNEEKVIANLIESIMRQTYPTELIDVYVCADNCTDNTAVVAEAAGAIVYERFNKKKVGKGYALDFLFGKVREMCGDEYYAGYFIFDADNLLDKRYVAEMNKAYCAGHKVITSYRNSKNYGDNWISAGYGQWFLREARQMNNVRMILGTSCAVSGTGFYVSQEIINRIGGWKYFLLTEDIQFSIDCVLHGEKIAYCHTAKYYDEQPVKFVDSWHQRMRWTKGYLQVFKKYGKRLIKGLFGTNGFSCFDMSMNIMPAIVLSIFSTCINVVTMLLSLLVLKQDLAGVLWSAAQSVINSYAMLLVVGLVTCLTEWKSIRCKGWKKLLYCLTFPLYTFTYLPIAIAALFAKVEWKPIRHTDTKSIEDMKK